MISLELYKMEASITQRNEAPFKDYFKLVGFTCVVFEIIF